MAPSSRLNHQNHDELHGEIGSTDRTDGEIADSDALPILDPYSGRTYSLDYQMQ